MFVLLIFEFEFIHYVPFEHACIGNNEVFVYMSFLKCFFKNFVQISTCVIIPTYEMVVVSILNPFTTLTMYAIMGQKSMRPINEFFHNLFVKCGVKIFNTHCW